MSNSEIVSFMQMDFLSPERGVTSTGVFRAKPLLISFHFATSHHLCFFEHEFRTIFHQTVGYILLLSLNGQFLRLPSSPRFSAREHQPPAVELLAAADSMAAMSAVARDQSALTTQGGFNIIQNQFRTVIQNVVCDIQTGSLRGFVTGPLVVPEYGLASFPQQLASLINRQDASVEVEANVSSAEAPVPCSRLMSRLTISGLSSKIPYATSNSAAWSASCCASDSFPASIAARACSAVCGLLQILFRAFGLFFGGRGSFPATGTKVDVFDFLSMSASTCSGRSSHSPQEHSAAAPALLGSEPAHLRRPVPDALLEQPLSLLFSADHCSVAAFAASCSTRPEAVSVQRFLPRLLRRD